MNKKITSLLIALFVFVHGVLSQTSMYFGVGTSDVPVIELGFKQNYNRLLLQTGIVNHLTRYTDYGVIFQGSVGWEILRDVTPYVGYAKHYRVQNMPSANTSHPVFGIQYTKRMGVNEKLCVNGFHTNNTLYATASIITVISYNKRKRNCVNSN